MNDELNLEHWRCYQSSKSGRWWAWDSTSLLACVSVRLEIWWDRLFGKQEMTFSEELFKRQDDEA